MRQPPPATSLPEASGGRLRACELSLDGRLGEKPAALSVHREVHASPDHPGTVRLPRYVRGGVWTASR